MGARCAAQGIIDDEETNASNSSSNDSSGAIDTAVGNGEAKPRRRLLECGVMAQIAPDLGAADAVGCEARRAGVGGREQPQQVQGSEGEGGEGERRMRQANVFKEQQNAEERRIEGAGTQ
jgi:hypothetical protein